MATTKTWKPRLVESTLIVFSILLAFGIDAWWQDRGYQKAEHSALVGIEQDFREYVDVLNISIERSERRLRFTDQLMEGLGPNAVQADSSLHQAAIVGFFDLTTFRSGTLETLIGTTGLSILESDSLKNALVLWGRQMENHSMVGEWAMEYARRYTFYLEARYPLQNLDRLAGVTNPVTGNTMNQSKFEESFTPLMRDLEFANIVYQNQYSTDIYLSSLNLLLVTANSILELVE